MLPTHCPDCGERLIYREWGTYGGKADVRDGETLIDTFQDTIHDMTDYCLACPEGCWDFYDFRLVRGKLVPIDKS